MSLAYILKTTVSETSANRFDTFIDLCQSQYDKPVHTMTEMRMRQNKKLRGDLWEQFCKLYLLNVYKTKTLEFANVWLFKDIPDDIREKLGLTTRDMGIDLVAIDTLGRYSAIQAKYRKRRPEKSAQIIGWKQLSTFYALVYRTGPFHRHIVMTNVDGVRHVSKKTRNDMSMCRARFRKMTYFEWKSLTCEEPTTHSAEEIRRIRIKYYDKLFQN